MDDGYQHNTDYAGRELQSILAQNYGMDLMKAHQLTDAIFLLIDARVQQELNKHLKEQHDEAK